ncbi:nuclear transport factor 2 family protein [Nocardia concava]|uniref:nuclear transport factor 2 family protein n=1 Tax=Nocardia concava TaxID=257281 RepID=UPI0002D830CD|nr:nuclear transport factor 2 family protein [Nocardia concava]
MRDFGIDLFDKWTAMWNRDYDLADEILAPEFTLRYAQPGASAYDTIHDPKSFIAQIQSFHDEVPGLTFTPDAIPVVEMDETRTGIVARPYRARITAPDGTTTDISGTDILRTTHGRIVEVWSVSGGLSGRSFYAAN